MKGGLKANLKKESLLLSLSKRSGSSFIWAKDCSFSIRSSTGSPSDSPTMTLSVADEELSYHNNKGVSIPLTSIHGGPLVVQFKGTFILRDYKQTCVKKPDFTRHPLNWMKTAFEAMLFSDAQIKVVVQSNCGWTPNKLQQNFFQLYNIQGTL